MVESGDWLTPHFNYADRWQKPILYYWLTAATYLVAGPTEWAARFWSALSGLGLVLLTWRVARGLGTRDDGAAWLAGATVATCYGSFTMARLSLPDLPLAFCITLTIWAALEQRWIVAGLAAALGFLFKGPVALAIPALVFAPIWWRERRTLTVRPRDVAIAAAVFAVVGLPWYAAMTAEHGLAYLESFFLSDNLERFATDRFNEPRPLWFYAPIVVGGMLPWSVYLLVLPWRSIRDVVRRQRRLLDEEWRLLLWVFVPLLFFTISVGKQPRYILPVLPPLAILLGRSLAWRINDRTAGRGLSLGTWLTAALYLVLAVLLLRAQPLFISVDPAMTALAIGVIVAGAVALAAIATMRRWSHLPVVTTASAAALLLAVQFGALTGRRPEPVERMAALVRTYRVADEPVAAYRVFVRNLGFYSRLKQEELFDEGRALDFFKSPDPVLLVVRAEDLPRLESIAELKAVIYGQVIYLDTANVRLRTLLSPIPAQDLETVLLVTNR